MERKLVTIRKVKEIKPIENADSIELAIVDGWQVVVKKGEFKKGDFGVYFEIDSFLPIEERYEFLRKGCYRKLVDGTEGFRLKTIKLRKQLSQGLLLPLSLFPEIPEYFLNPDSKIKETNLKIDYSDLLNVVLYDPPIPACLSGLMKGRVPSWICKTHQERIQNLPEYFDKYKNVTFEETEKLDGSSMTVYFNNGEFGVCSHNLDLKESEGNSFWKMARKLDLENILKQYGKNIALQGELIGEGIQKNPCMIKGHEFRLFDIWDIDKQRYLTRAERFRETEKIFPDLRMPNVPITNDVISIFERYKNVNDLLKHTEGKSRLNPDKEREGLVFKSTELIDGQVLSFKCINNKYLLKGD